MLRIAVCDDNDNDRETLAAYIREAMAETSRSFSLSCFQSGTEALEYRQENPPFDLIFLDIYMNGESGVDTARLVRETDKKAKIFLVTVSDMHALQGFEVRAYDYLLKPVDRERLRESLLSASEETDNERKKIIEIITRRKSYPIPFSDIVFVESDLRKVVFFLDDGSEHISYDSLDNVAKKLDKRFIRCHSGFLVNMDKVRRIDPDKLFIMSNGKTASITKRNYSKVYKEYIGYISEKADD